MGRSGVKGSTVSVSYCRADDLNEVTRECAAAEIDEPAAADPWRAFRWCLGQKHYCATYSSAARQACLGIASNASWRGWRAEIPTE